MTSKYRSLIIVLLIIGLFVAPHVAAQDSPPDVRFGAVEAFRDPVAAAEAGVGWDRILFYWSELQPAGPDDWNEYHVPDDWLALADAQGREVVGLLKHTPQWATDGLPGCGIPRGLDLPIDDPGNLWATFVRGVAGMYAGRIDRWIIWNEPDIPPGTYGAEWCGSIEGYYRLLKVAYLSAHAAHPDAVIHLAGMTTWHDKTYLRRLLAIAGQDPTSREHDYYFDVASLHIYFRPETIPPIFNETRAALAAFGLWKPIWLNETNSPPNSDPLWPMEAANYQVSLEEQSSFLLQAFALALSQGAERIAVYKWLDSNLQAGFEPFGLIRPGYNRRPAFDAFRAITAHYSGTVAAQEERELLYSIVDLDRGHLATRVLWARTEAEVTVSIPARTAQALLIDQTGTEQILRPSGQEYTLTLPGARCADERGCIIGGHTFLVVEERSASSPSTDGPAVELTDSAVVTTSPTSPSQTGIPSTTATSPAQTSQIPVTSTATSPVTATSSPHPVATTYLAPTATPPLVVTFPATPTTPPSPTAATLATPTASPSLIAATLATPTPFLAPTSTSPPTPTPAPYATSTSRPTSTVTPASATTPPAPSSTAGSDPRTGPGRNRAARQLEETALEQRLVGLAVAVFAAIVVGTRLKRQR